MGEVLLLLCIHVVAVGGGVVGAVVTACGGG